MKMRTVLPLFILALALGATVSGQTYQQLAPKTPPENKPAQPVVAPAPSEPPPANPDEVLIPRLNGILLLPSAERISPQPVQPSGALVVDGLPWLKVPLAETVARDYIGRPLTRGDLGRLLRAMVRVCRSSDRPVADVFAPPQDVSKGVLQVVVMVAKLGKLRVEGNQYFRDGIFLDQMRLKPGEEIAESTALGDLDRLNQNPFRQVDLVYASGAQPGYTDVVLRVHDTRPERGYVGYEDSGNEATGLGRVLAGFNLGDLWNDDHQLSYQYTRSTDGDRLEAHSASYTVLLPWHHFVNVFGDWSEAKTEPNRLFNLDGTSWVTGLRYTVPLPILHAYTQSIAVGADYKWSNNNLGFGGTTVFASPTNIAQGVVSYTGSMSDAWGTTQGSLTFFDSPGGIGGLNHDHNFAVQRAGASADYRYLQLAFSRVERLPRDFTLSFAGAGQWSADRLLPSEEFGLGGGASIRGYDERLFNADSGISEQLELRTPAHHFLGAVPDQTLFLVFFDAGRAWVKNPQPGESNETAASIGPGLRCNLSRHGSLRLDYGWQLVRAAGTRSGRPNVSLVISY